MGLLSEIAQPEQIGDILPIFAQSEQTAIVSLFLIAVAPWALHLGSFLAMRNYKGEPAKKRLSLPVRFRRIFLVFSIAISSLIAYQSIEAFLNAPYVWTLRADMGEKWGPWIIWFYIPLALLIFLVSTTELSTKLGKAHCLFMVVAAICASMPVGERTLMLLPIVVVFLFAGGLNLKRSLVVPAIAFVCAGLLLPLVKSQFGDSESDTSVVDLMWSIVHGDISRAGVLGHAVEEADVVGTHVLPYPMAGYIYGAAFFVPRSLAPWKGQSSASYFTGNLSNFEPNEIRWNYGIGLIEESVINCGLVLTLPALAVIGLLMGLLDRLTSPAVILPIRLATLWVGGYQIPAMLQTFGPAVLICAVFLWLVRRHSRPPTLQSQPVVPELSEAFPLKA